MSKNTKAEGKLAKAKEQKVIKHNVTEKEIKDNNLVGVLNAGDEIQIPVEKPKKKKKKFIEGKEILSEEKVQDRFHIKTIDGLGYILSKEEYDTLVG